MALRVNDRLRFDDPRFASQLWWQTGLREALQQEEFRGLWGGGVVGLNSNIRIYRYTEGQYFDPHYDDSNNVLVYDQNLGAPPTPAKTTWTILLYLTTSGEGGEELGGCSGGETVFFPNERRLPSEEISVPPMAGLLLLHKHGDDCLLVRTLLSLCFFQFTTAALACPSNFGPAPAATRPVPCL
ncbi:hypothetical protein ACHAQA_009301 [Verticillium albo-atrum]